MIQPAGARYAVIGAGAAGLATIRALRAHGIDFDCFESRDTVGGHWNTDYEALHLITPRDVSAFAGHPMPSNYPHYPSRQQVLDYLHQFAEREGLLKHIQFGTSVESAVPAEPDGDGSWTVTLSNGTVAEYDGVIVCNGHLWDPYVPSTPGTYTGKHIHSGVYQNVDDLEGRRILVVGTGNSGCDIATDIAQQRFETYVSMRSGQIFQPKSILGKPRANLAFSKLPPFFSDLIATALAAVITGPSSAYGMPTPEARRIRDSPPIVNTQLLHWIQHGRATVVPTIDRFDGLEVTFSDGTVREIDTIVWCTGFKITLPFLDEKWVQREGTVPVRFGGAILPKGVEGLFYIGLCAPRGGQFPVYDVQAKLLVEMLKLRESRGTRLAEAFEALEQPETQIDLLPYRWLLQVDQAHRHLRRMAGEPAPHRLPRSLARAVQAGADRLTETGLIRQRKSEGTSTSHLSTPAEN